MNDSLPALAHLIHIKTGLLRRFHLRHVPRVGDEIRLWEDKFYTVIHVVWVFDEPECPMQRVNIGVDDAPKAEN